jgi:TonB family protein
MRTRITLAVGLLALTGILAADDKSAGKELLEKAGKISDIRAEGAPAFRMEGSFRLVPKNGGKESEGSFSEVWASKTRWRREFQTASFHEIEIASADKKWILDSGADRPSAALHALSAEAFSRYPPEVGRVSERELGAVKASCVESKDSGSSKALDCVDPQSGVFLLRETMVTPPNNFPINRRSCVYRNYESFGEHLFPRSVRCSTGSDEDLEMTVVRLVLNPSPEEAEFSPPAGAIEMRKCRGHISAPSVIHAPDPSYPAHHKENPVVVLYLIVAQDGTPLSPEVARSGGVDFDREAIKTIRSWRFKPAVCDGSPTAVNINVEVSFRKY